MDTVRAIFACRHGSGLQLPAPLAEGLGILDTHAVIETDKYGIIQQHSLTSPLVGGAAGDTPFIEQYLLTDTLLNNPYETITIKHMRVALDFTPYQPGAAGRIEQVIPDRLEARPGETVNLTVKIRRYDQQGETRQLAVKIPEYAAGSMMAIGVFGGAEAGLSRQVLAALPTRAEGVPGLIRLSQATIPDGVWWPRAFSPRQVTRWAAASCATCPRR